MTTSHFSSAGSATTTTSSPSTSSRSTSSPTAKPAPVSVRSIEPVAVGWSAIYQANHQVQYLQLQAEMETLLLELKAIQSQRSTSCISR